MGIEMTDLEDVKDIAGAAGKPQFSGEWVKLGDVASYVNGYAFKPTDYASEGKPIIRIQDLTGNAYQTNRFAGSLDDKYRVVWGDVLISWSASLGVYVWSAEEAWLNQHIFKVQFNKLPVNKRFFIHQTRYVIAESASLAHGATMRHLTKKVFDNLPFFYPSEHDQEEIACHLDGIQLQIDSASDMLARLDALVKSRFIEIFGDCRLARQDQGWKRIGNIGEVLGGATPKTQVEEYWGGGLPWLTPAEIGDSIYVNATSRTLTSEGVRSCSLSKLPAGTVLLSSRAPIGKVAIAGTDMYCNQGFKNIVCGDSVLPRYLYSLLKFNSDYLNSLGRGATFTEISKRIVEDIKIPVPAVELQLQFECFAQQVDKLRFDVQQQIDKLELLKNSLMQEYFG